MYLLCGKFYTGVWYLVPMGGSRKGDWESSKSSKSGGWKGDGKWWPLGIAHKDLHPRNLTWIPKIAIFERRHILKPIIFGIYVRFRGGIQPMSNIKIYRLPS